VPGDGKIGSIFHYINGRFDIHQRVYSITRFDSNMFGKYILYFMSKFFGPYALENTVKATVDSLRLPTFQNFVIHFPPTLGEQEAIAEVLSDMDAEITALEERLEKAKAIKQGMMQQLLTGKIRLVD
jgi:type I restriction enzyme S subunit